ncbi:MAG: hypothetical protein V7603_553 [Micromonosporaceae bacterium]
MSDESIAELLRRFRLAAGLTQEELAEKAKLSVRTVRNAERLAGPRLRPDSGDRLASALGLTGDERRDVHRAVRAAWTGRQRQRLPGGRPADPPRHVVPAQLPADVTAFTGRTPELAQLDALLLGRDRRAAGADRDATAVVISAVSGTAGVGKTALAVHWAHQARNRFPDGQLYVNLRGYDPEQPVDPARALAQFLTALGLPDGEIPLETDERAARYRTEIANRQMLIVLDNAATVEQVRPLLPGTPSCAVVVTSRDTLAGLVAVHGARRVELGLLSPGDSSALLGRLIGPRATRDPHVTATLADQCARLPLALRILAEVATARADAPLADLATELADRRLRLLDGAGDPRATVTTVFSWSLQHLPAAATRAFRLVGLHPGLDFDAYGAAALTGTGIDDARQVLDLLGRAHLIQPTSGGRYGMHDLLRAYASQLVTEQDTEAQRPAALGRLFGYYVASAARAMDILYPAEAHRRPRITPPSTPTPVDPETPQTARRWLSAERATLTAVAAYCAANGWPAHAVNLSATLYRYLDGGHYLDALIVHGCARSAAAQTGDRDGEGHALLGLGVVHSRLGRHADAVEELDQARTVFQLAGNQAGEARALQYLAFVEEKVGRYESAADHNRHARRLYRRVGDQVGEAATLNGLGTIETILGRCRPAARHLKQALALFSRLGHRTGEASTLDSIGLVEERSGGYGAAARRFERAVELFRELGDRGGEGWALTHLGTVQGRLGLVDRAAGSHRQALACFVEIGDRDGEPAALCGLGQATQAAGRHAEALSQYTAALAVATDTGARDYQARAHAGLGRAHASLGDPARAHEQYLRALAIFDDLGLPDAVEVRSQLAALDRSEPAAPSWSR